MRNFIIIGFLFLASFCQAQTTKAIDGVLGIKFGSSTSQVIETLKAKGATVNSDPTSYSIGFSNLSLGGRKTIVLFVHFLNDQAFEILIVFKADQEAKTIEFYNSLTKDISELYGSGKIAKTFKQPYSEGDGYEITALKSGNATYQTDWTDSNSNEILAEIASNSTQELTVMLFYNDAKLTKLRNDQKKSKNKSEF